LPAFVDVLCFPISFLYGILFIFDHAHEDNTKDFHIYILRLVISFIVWT